MSSTFADTVCDLVVQTLDRTRYPAEQQVVKKGTSGVVVRTLVTTNSTKEGQTKVGIELPEC